MVAGMIPMDLLAKQRMYAYRKMFNAVEAREENLNGWQKRWVASPNARRTIMLIPDIRIWLQWKLGDIGFYISQLLTGHAHRHSARYARILFRVQGIYFLIVLDSVLKGLVLILISLFVFSTNARNRARPRTYSKLWIA